MKRNQPRNKGTSWIQGLIIFLFVFLAFWLFIVVRHVLHPIVHAKNDSTNNEVGSLVKQPTTVKEKNKSYKNSDIDDSYHIVFSTGCSEFQDWQSIGVYSSAIAVGQKGIITRIASGCTADQEKSIRHAMSHLPENCRVHFAPNTQVRDHYNNVYKYANKPLGMMHWLTYADPPIKPTSTIALVDPDFFFLRPLYHDSFNSPSKYIATGKARKTPMPKVLIKGTMVAQRYGIGGAPWRTTPGLRGQKGNVMMLPVTVIILTPE